MEFHPLFVQVIRVDVVVPGNSCPRRCLAHGRACLPDSARPQRCGGRGPGGIRKLLNDAEDALDRAELAISRDEDDYIPWEQVKAGIGLS